MTNTSQLQKRAYEFLVGEISEGNFAPDMIYSEAKIAKNLGFSRTPVREALQRLAQEGYIDILPSRGFIIHSLTEREVLNMYQMRSAVETYCLLAYAGEDKSERKDAVVAELERIIAEQKRCVDGTYEIERYPALDHAFHRAIIECFGNELFNEAFSKYSTSLLNMTKYTMNSRERISVSCREHMDILERIKAADPTGASECLHKHIDHPTEYVIYSLKGEA